MSNSISDQKFNRQIQHLTRHLPDQAELNGKRQGSSFYKHTNERNFVESYRVTYKHISGLKDKFQLTPSQNKQLSKVKQKLLNDVESALDNCENPPANWADFIKERKKA